jgi:TPP-dependent pyruvate/acetoin dehydrogenase alpha subunit
MQTDIKAEAKAAVEYALNAAYPAAEDVTKHVFVETA